MTDLQELQQFVRGEWQAQLNQKERELIAGVVSVHSRQEMAIRYNPMLSYGSEKHETWGVTMADGSRKKLYLQYGGDTDGLWFEMSVN